MAKIPRPSGEKDLPVSNLPIPEMPKTSPLISTQLQEVPKLNIKPVESPVVVTVPAPTPEKEEKPSIMKEENCVTIGGIKVELKPTKLKYFRNKAASAYGVIKAVPLYELLTYGTGVFDEQRDADHLLFDFLTAAFDDSIFVRDHYDDFDAETIEQVVKIFGRINHIDEKEEAARKNREAQAAKR